MTDLGDPPNTGVGNQAGASAVDGVLVRRLIETYRLVRNTTEALSEPLTAEDQTAQSMPDASPAKWHRAHTTWFFETFVLGELCRGYEPVDPRYRVLFNSYYNGVGEQYHRPHRGLVTRPGAEEIGAYRKHVDEALTRFLAGGAVTSEAVRRIVLGLHHEQQHQELLLTDLKHLWSHNPLHPVYELAVGQGGPAHDSAASEHGGKRAWRTHDGGVVGIGFEGQGFRYDNEGPRHDVIVHPFQMRDGLVTAGEFAEFVRDGAYDKPSLWLDAGFATAQQLGWRMPLYWQQRDDAFFHYTLRGFVPVDPEQPVTHISFYEAEAFARWAGARLPTEQEWELDAPEPADADLGGPGSGLHPGEATGPDHYGHCWQWTRSDYAPYPGFCPEAGAIGEYNGKFMSGQYGLRGSSCFTPGGHARRTYRNFFAPTARWQLSGIRLAKDV